MRLALAAACLGLGLSAPAEEWHSGATLKNASDNAQVPPAVGVPVGDSAKAAKLVAKVRAEPAPPPASPKVRSAIKDLYAAYTGSRAALMKLLRFGAPSGHLGAYDLVTLINTLDSSAFDAAKLGPSQLDSVGGLDGFRLSLYTALRAADPKLSARDAEDKTGITAARGDPLNSLRRGDGPEPSANILALRKLYLARGA
jgi:hypothetical protein